MIDKNGFSFQFLSTIMYKRSVNQLMKIVIQSRKIYNFVLALVKYEFQQFNDARVLVPHLQY